MSSWKLSVFVEFWQRKIQKTLHGARDEFCFMRKQLTIRSRKLNGFGRIGPAPIVEKYTSKYIICAFFFKVSEWHTEPPNCCTHINTPTHKHKPIKRAGRPRGAKAKRGRLAGGRFSKRVPSAEEIDSEPQEPPSPPGGAQQPGHAGEDDTKYDTYPFLFYYIQGRTHKQKFELKKKNLKSGLFFLESGQFFRIKIDTGFEFLSTPRFWPLFRPTTLKLSEKKWGSLDGKI